MKTIFLSKSRYCKAKQCNKMLWLDCYMPEVGEKIDNETIFANGTKVGELAKDLFGKHVDISFNKDLTEMIRETEKNMQIVPQVITEASFEWNGNFCSVDILKNTVDGVEIYEVKSSTEVKKIYLDDAAYQLYILLNKGYKVKSVNIVYINNEYVRRGALDLNSFFNISDITEIAYSKQEEIALKIEEIHKYMTNTCEQREEIGLHCYDPYECPYWKHCTKHLPEKNVFSIAGMRKTKMFELYNNGIYSYEQLIEENINPKYKEQVEMELYSLQDKIDKEKISDFMNTLSYPIYFLDFETYNKPIPEYDGMKPYMQIPFQYSLHYIEKEGDKLNHKEFLAEAGQDPRRAFAESLVSNVPTDVCVLAYNMGFEKGRIKELAEYFPDLRNDLMKIHDNIKDLMIPFSTRAYYTKQMQGSYSIKYVLPALFPDEPSLDYHNLSVVHKGDEASAAFVSLSEKTEEEQEVIRKGLLEYCKLDTFAMVKIWEKLKEI